MELEDDFVLWPHLHNIECALSGNTTGSFGPKSEVPHGPGVGQELTVMTSFSARKQTLKVHIR
jgi:hypothetical protein